jgi:hypothetical protein
VLQFLEHKASLPASGLDGISGQLNFRIPRAILATSRARN